MVFNFAPGVSFSNGWQSLNKPAISDFGLDNFSGEDTKLAHVSIAPQLEAEFLSFNLSALSTNIGSACGLTGRLNALEIVCGHATTAVHLA